MSDINEYIENQKNPQKEICQKLREIILDTFPDITEEMKWGVPSFGGGLYYIVALKSHVNLGFSIKNLSTAELLLFDGGGKTTKHVEIDSLEKIDLKQIVKLLKLIEEKQK